MGEGVGCCDSLSSPFAVTHFFPESEGEHSDGSGGGATWTVKVHQQHLSRSRSVPLHKQPEWGMGLSPDHRARETPNFQLEPLR